MVPTTLGLLIPYFRLEWEHEFEDDSSVLKKGLYGLSNNDSEQGEDHLVSVNADEPDEDYFNFGLGFSMIFRHGVLAFVDYETIFGLDDVTDHQFAAGLEFKY